MVSVCSGTNVHAPRSLIAGTPGPQKCPTPPSQSTLWPAPTRKWHLFVKYEPLLSFNYKLFGQFGYQSLYVPWKTWLTSFPVIKTSWMFWRKVGTGQTTWGGLMLYRDMIRGAAVLIIMGVFNDKETIAVTKWCLLSSPQVFVLM